ncbi:MAG: hypothetical protein UR79_C0002G0094 [Candidatus Campbellbacteria bacterium GW2011_GWD1_35_49]|nr:MAG: hypothetical protein UR74_C0002G0239 [Candidatus Campbellbacteria bacterium GW2011_GWD2_35_24]KKP75859.1 MAG: hypothetical protein UR75_C0002G0240 [Candidatus Campbellbacteria bacterium GW2011_GWC2_35_28]KKP76893.1 MAG: hypothetical protein UR76_C0002G0094 [Candidatus Campbellbacteria bacterium GW2011_GWC1_35_31]KKP78819.1 MAG: hypothetical protein UR79_C0002G0094 [Candidatus Campbellbacteria bacterium GW2011_GWD1_35_49]
MKKKKVFFGEGHHGKITEGFHSNITSVTTSKIREVLSPIPTKNRQKILDKK